MTTALREISRSVNRAWESVAGGWRELIQNGRDALTRYVPARGDEPDAGWEWQTPGWGLLPGEVMETRKAIVVQIELPGIARDDVDVEIEGVNLVIRGEKHFDREHVAESYYLRERAYGRFERVVPLPPNADKSAPKASYRAGVLTVEFPKIAKRASRRIAIQ